MPPSSSSPASSAETTLLPERPSSQQQEQPAKSLTAAQSAINAPSDRSLRCPYYCEENVWRLAYRKMNERKINETKKKNATYWVVFISNPSECVALFHQRAVEHPLQPVFWDYHVILLEQEEEHQIVDVWDMDSYLPFPCPLKEYCTKTFPQLLLLSSLLEKSSATTAYLTQLSSPKYAPLLRIVEASVFLKHFSSDRKHMFDAQLQKWNAPPPHYSCICPQSPGGDRENEETSNLIHYRTMTADDLQNETTTNCNHKKYGRVLTLSRLLEQFIG